MGFDQQILEKTLKNMTFHDLRAFGQTAAANKWILGPHRDYVDVEIILGSSFHGLTLGLLSKHVGGWLD